MDQLGAEVSNLASLNNDKCSKKCNKCSLQYLLIQMSKLQVIKIAIIQKAQTIKVRQGDLQRLMNSSCDVLSKVAKLKGRVYPFMIYLYIGINALLVPTFQLFSILVPTFPFHHFQSLNQLTRVILVLSVSQQTEITEMTNGGIKILLKIYCSTHQIKKKKKSRSMFIFNKNTDPLL